MNNEELKLLTILSSKEALLADIIIWLKTKNLYEECMQIIAPKLLKEQKE